MIVHGGSCSPTIRSIRNQAVVEPSTITVSCGSIIRSAMSAIRRLVSASWSRRSANGCSRETGLGIVALAPGPRDQAARLEHRQVAAGGHRRDAELLLELGDRDAAALAQQRHHPAAGARPGRSAGRRRWSCARSGSGRPRPRVVDRIQAGGEGVVDPVEVDAPTSSGFITLVSRTNAVVAPGTSTTGKPW